MHFVWSTADRLPLISEEIETELYRLIESEAKRLGADVLAIGGTENHVHLLVWLPPKLAPSQFMQQLKGTSSHVGRRLRGEEALFRWQHGFGVFSLSRPDIPCVKRYIANQKERHAAGALWPTMEATGEDRS